MLLGTPGFDGDDYKPNFLQELEHNMTLVTDDDSNEPIPSELLKFEDKWRSIQKLIWCASTPIVRGKEYGVVGSGFLVIKARKLLEDLMTQDLWPDEDDLAPFKNCRQPIWANAFTCNRCRAAV
jgi:hypothetical protein